MKLKQELTKLASGEYCAHTLTVIYILKISMLFI